MPTKSTIMVTMNRSACSGFIGDPPRVVEKCMLIISYLIVISRWEEF